MNCRLWVRGWPTRWISMAPPLAIAMCGKRSAGQSIDGLAGMGFRLGFGSGLWVFGSSSYGIAVESAEYGCNFIVGLCVQWQFFHSAESSMHLGGAFVHRKRFLVGQSITKLSATFNQKVIKNTYIAIQNSILKLQINFWNRIELLNTVFKIVLSQSYNPII